MGARARARGGLARAAKRRRRRLRRRPAVLVTPVTRQDVPLFIEAVGTLDGYVNADIRARVKGYLQLAGLQGRRGGEGRAAALHDRAAEYTTAVGRAKAARGARRAPRSAQPRPRSSATRGSRRRAVVSKQELENADAADADADGQVAGRARPQLRQAQLNLSYTQIRSPIAGVAGLALVRVGNLVGQDGPTLLTTVSQLDPIRVNFPMSEIDYVTLPRTLEAARRARSRLGDSSSSRSSTRHETAEGGDPGARAACSPTEASTRTRASSSPSNRQVDASTGTIQLQALFPNPDGLLRPGQYGARAHPSRRRGQGGAGRAREGAHLRAGHVLARRRRRRTTRCSSGASSSGPRARLAHRHEGRRARASASSSRACRRSPTARVVDPQPAPPSSLARRRLGAASRLDVRREALSHVGVLHPPAHRRDRHRDPHRAHRAVSLLGLPIAQFPQILPPQVNLTTTYHRRRRAHHRAVGRDADRAADERRRPHALHPVDQRQRRHDEPGRHVRRRHRRRHRQRAGPQPLLAGAAVPAAGREELRRHDQEVARLPADGHLALLAGRPLRPDVPRQLRAHQHQRRAPAREGRRRHPQPRRRRTTRCASG